MFGVLTLFSVFEKTNDYMLGYCRVKDLFKLLTVHYEM